jgi:hypothetical protein
LRNGPVPDPEHLPDVMKKHFTEQMAYFVACPWSEGQGGDLDGEHSDLLTHALITLVGKQNDEVFGGNNMYTQWKQVKRITLSSIKTLEDLNTRLEDLRYSETTLSQTVGTNLEYVMSKTGYDEYLARENGRQLVRQKTRDIPLARPSNRMTRHNMNFTLGCIHPTDYPRNMRLLVVVG